MVMQFHCDRCGEEMAVQPDGDRTDFDIGHVLDPGRRSRQRDELQHLCESCTTEFKDWLAEQPQPMTQNTYRISFGPGGEVGIGSKVPPEESYIELEAESEVDALEQALESCSGRPATLEQVDD